MNVVTTSILIVGAVLLIALAVIYFGLVRRRRESEEALQRVRVGGIYPAARQQNVSTGDDPGNKLDSRRACSAFRMLLGRLAPGQETVPKPEPERPVIGGPSTRPLACCHWENGQTIRGVITYDRELIGKSFCEE